MSNNPQTSCIGKSKARALLKIIGFTIIALGIILPPKATVAALLPLAGAPYFNKLVAGMWCLKFALFLNGLALVIFPILYHYLFL